MVVKVVATPCLQWCPTSMASKKRALNDGILACRSAWLGTTSSKLWRTQTFHFGAKQRPLSLSSTIRRTCSASFDNNNNSLSDEEFSRKIQELALRFQISDEEDNGEKPYASSSKEPSSMEDARWLEVQHEPPDWNNIEMKANSVDLPLSLRMIKMKIKKNQWQEGFIEAVSENAYCSVKKAFSSMVFIIRELHSYTLQMRELLFYEDLQGILARVQKEMHASFVWLFQQVFSHTPILMVHVMILLANFTVHSMSTSAAIAAVTPPIATVEEREIGGATTTIVSKFDAPATKSSSLSSTGGSYKTTSVGGNNGGGSKARPVASGTDGDGWAHRSENLHRPIVPDGVSPFTRREREEESVSGCQGVEEIRLWNSLVDEASRMQSEERDEALDHETLQRFVSPVTVKIDGDDEYEDYFRTELLYQTGLGLEPNNVLLLTNYAQFLYIVAHDYDRAEEYFKKAIAVEPKDAEAHNKYATFLWQVRKDLWAAEETFLEAISADPSNSFYAANYAHFLWNTGGEDTCFPLSSADDETLDNDA